MESVFRKPRGDVPPDVCKTRKLCTTSSRPALNMPGTQSFSSRRSRGSRDRSCSSRLSQSRSRLRPLRASWPEKKLCSTISKKAEGLILVEGVQNPLPKPETNKTETSGGGLPLESFRNFRDRDPATGTSPLSSGVLLLKLPKGLAQSFGSQRPKPGS